MCMRSREYPMENACQEQIKLLEADDHRKCRNPFSAGRKRFFILIAHWESDEDLVKFKPTGLSCNLYSSVRELISDAKYMLEDKGERMAGRLWWEVNWLRLSRGFVCPISKLALDAEGKLLGFYHQTGPERLSRKLREQLLADDGAFTWAGDMLLRRWYFP